MSLGLSRTFKGCLGKKELLPKSVVLALETRHTLTCKSLKNAKFTDPTPQILLKLAFFVENLEI